MYFEKKHSGELRIAEIVPSFKNQDEHIKDSY